MKSANEQKHRKRTSSTTSTQENSVPSLISQGASA